MYRAFRLAGCHSRWDDFVNDTESGAERVDQLPGLYMDEETRGVTERLASSMLSLKLPVKDTRQFFPKLPTLTSARLDGQTHLQL